MEQNFQKHRQDLKKQIIEAHGKVVYSYTTHLKTVDHLILKNKTIKYLQIALSAISTGGFIGGLIANEFISTCIGGVFSTFLLAMNLYFKEFNLNVEISQHSATANSLWIIREDYISLLTDMPVLTDEEICIRREHLKKQTSEVYKTAPKTSPKSYRKAQQALKNAEEQYFSNEELRQLLPTHLRINDDENG